MEPRAEVGVRGFFVLCCTLVLVRSGLPKRVTKYCYR